MGKRNAEIFCRVQESSKKLLLDAAKRRRKESSPRSSMAEVLDDLLQGCLDACNPKTPVADKALKKAIQK